MDKPEAKKMNYSTHITRHIDVKDAIVVGGTDKKAEELRGTWIKLNETQYALEEEDQTTIIERRDNIIGCACEGFTTSSMDLLCEHLVAFEALNSPPQRTIESSECRGLRQVLVSEGWTSENRRLYPPMKEPEVVASLPPVDEDATESSKLDPIHEEKKLDTGVDETEDPNTDEEQKIYSRKCERCGFLSKGYDLATVIQRIAEHHKTCTKNPANKKKAKVPEKPKPTDAKPAPIEKPPRKERVKPTSKKFTCEICGTEYDTADDALNCIEKCKEAQEIDETKALVAQEQISDGETWTDSQLEVMRRTVAAKATPEEFAYFLNVAKYSGLNPFLKEIYFIKNEKGQTTIITGRDGYLTIAKRDPQFRGIQSMEVCETDVFETSVVMNDEGKIVQNMTHQISNFKERGEIIGAWSRGQMEGQEPVIIFAAMKEYDKSDQARGGQVWKQYPSSMIRKVAEAMVLKRIAGISGLVTEAEIGGTDLVQIEGGE